MTRLSQPTLLVLSIASVMTLGCGQEDNPGTPPLMPGGSGAPRPGAGGAGGSPTTPSPVTPPGTGGAPAPQPTPPAVTPPPGNVTPAPVAADGDYSWLMKPLPVLWITLNDPAAPLPGRLLTKDKRALARVKVIHEHDGTPVTSIEGKKLAVDADILLEGRGSSSFTAGQKFMGPSGYNIEFHDGQRNGVGRSLLGMPSNADWGLVTCVSDKTCIRNALSYAIAQELAFPAGRWAPRFRWAEVYFNGKYHGVYLVAERPKDDRNRVNLPNAPDSAPPEQVGYLISADSDCRAALNFDPLDPKSQFADRMLRASSKPMTANSNCLSPGGNFVPGNRRWKIRSPNPDSRLTDAQRAYIQAAHDQMTMTVEGATGNWKNAIDVQSFLDYYVMSELSNNVDAFFKSWYMYKLPDAPGGAVGKWVMGPVWDFDLAYGNANYYFRYCHNNTTLGPVAKKTPPASAIDDPAPPWVVAPINKDMTFRNDLRCRWNSLRTSGPLAIEKIEARIDLFVAHLRTAKMRDTAKWMNYPKYVWPNNFVAQTWDDDVKYLKFWIRKRVAWVDSSLRGTCTGMPAPMAVLQMAAPASMTVDRSQTMWDGEENDRFNDYVDIQGTTPPEWSCQFGPAPAPTN
jgi:hypothetical protein